MTHNNRENIYRIKSHSNLSQKSLEESLIKHVYSDKQQWNWFIKLFLLTLGAGFTIAGIIFFFAYNWSDLHKFAKLGLIETVLIVATCLVFIPSLSSTTKNIVLTAATMLVGVMFAVYGQIYQTGANAYDFFMGWTAFITVWILISNFPPLWLIYIILINTTLYLYGEQVAYYWEEHTVYIFHFCLNVFFLASTLLLERIWKNIDVPVWFTNAVALLAVFFATTGIIIELFDYYENRNYILLIVTFCIYGLWIYYAIRKKNIFYLAVIAFSSVIIFSALIIRIGDDSGMFFFVCLFIIGSVTAVIKGLLSLHKMWLNE